jgi:hypothetical protein
MRSMSCFARILLPTADEFSFDADADTDAAAVPVSRSILLWLVFASAVVPATQAASAAR